MSAKVIFCWSGFPQYAARSVGAFVQAHPELEVSVLATRPRVPVEGMERLCNCPVTWLDSNSQPPTPNPQQPNPQQPNTQQPNTPQPPTTLFITGWHVPAFMAFGAAVRKAGGRVILMCDNNWVDGRGWRLRLRKVVENVRFRLFKRRLFDGFLVPGKSGRRLLASWGVPDICVSEGMYAADATLFRDGGPLAERPKRILFVGQFAERKNVRRLVEAFRAATDGTWELHLFGCGPVTIEAGAGVVAHPFVQPEALAAEYRSARIFCLPSVVEHWGLVVHEAALSGCVLALSERVGAADDLLGAANGVRFDPLSTEDMAAKLRAAMALEGAALAAARLESLEKARRLGLGRFAVAVCGEGPAGRPGTGIWHPRCCGQGDVQPRLRNPG